MINVERKKPVNKRMDYHVFVAMPFGKKEGIDFNEVYEKYIVAALAPLGFDVFRADKEMRAGDIITDMFQELLIADLVVVDVSIDNPNVWYELGIRHALKARGVIQVNGSRDYMPFDVFGQRTLRYNLKDGVPDSDKVEEDKQLLAEFAIETMQSWYGRKISPVYQLLKGLNEPSVDSLKTKSTDGVLSEFWSYHEKWEQRIDLARKKDKPADIMLLAEEAPTRVFKLEAFKKAGDSLQKLQHYKFALEQFEKALQIDPNDLRSLQKKAIILGRLARYDEAESILLKLRENNNDAETYGLLGRVEKDKWVNSWRAENTSSDDIIQDAKHYIEFLNLAIQRYLEGFKLDPSDHYTGINALTLSVLKDYLEESEHSIPSEELVGGLKWSINSALHKNPHDYWAHSSNADLELLIGDQTSIESKYKKAIVHADKDWFALDSTRQQLHILKDLGFKFDIVDIAISILNREISKSEAPEDPGKVILFSGHMIDKPDREEPRFPADKEAIANQSIAEQLDNIGVSSNDLALCGGACGGDILFAEECLKRDMKLEIRIQSNEPLFIKESVIFAGENWRDRFNSIKNNQNTTILVQPYELGEPPKHFNKYERNNIWQLYSALARGPEKTRFICLWNGKGGDGIGGTQHMKETIEKYTGNVYVIDTTKLW